MFPKENSQKFQTNDFVIVKIAEKKTIKHYIALILSDAGCNEFNIKYLKRSGQDKFVFLNEDDSVFVVDALDIVTKLKQPLLNNRDQYIFKDCLQFNNLE